MRPGAMGVLSVHTENTNVHKLPVIQTAGGFVNLVIPLTDPAATIEALTRLEVASELGRNVLTKAVEGVCGADAALGAIRQLFAALAALN